MGMTKANPEASTGSGSRTGVSIGSGSVYTPKIATKSFRKPLKKDDVEPEYLVETPCQYLLICPDGYHDFKTVVRRLSVDDLGRGINLTGKIKVLRFYKGKKQLEPGKARFADRMFAVLVDASGIDIHFSAFGRVGYKWSDLRQDTEVTVHGIFRKEDDGSLKLDAPLLLNGQESGKLIASYPRLGKASGASICRAIEKYSDPLYVTQAAELIEANLEGGWSEDVCNLTEFDSAKDLLENLHWPQSIEAGTQARHAARILSVYGLISASMAEGKQVRPQPKSMWSIDRDSLNALAKKLPFPLTKCQIGAIKQMVSMIASPAPMNAVLSGDVGTGKTLVFLFASILSALMGKQVAICLPNTLLVEQIAKEARALSVDVPITTATGLGIFGPRDLTSNGGILIGTTAIISAVDRGEIIIAPDLLIVDEQHKFSVAQRESLKKAHTNYLEATATPIPRTAALLLHGGRRVLRLTTCPVKKEIKTTVVTDDKSKASVLVSLANKVMAGEQVAVVYSLVEDSEHIEAKSIATVIEVWKKLLPNETIGVLHGQMNTDEKASVLEEFKAKKFNLLIASSVIEVGVTVPGLYDVAVVNAERMGVVALHQLRGRLARLGGEGRFYLCMGEAAGRDAIERMQLLVKYSNGFDLAEADALKRGFGDILNGTEQTGKTRFLFQGVPLLPPDISYVQDLILKKHEAQSPAPA